MFTYIDVGKEQYPDYIKSVPSLVTNGNIIKGEQVFNYINNLVQQLVKQNPELQTYMDQLDSQNRSNDQSNNLKKRPAAHDLYWFQYLMLDSICLIGVIVWVSFYLLSALCHNLFSHSTPDATVGKKLKAN